MVPFVIIYLFNWIIFVIIIASLLRRKFSSKQENTKSFIKEQLIIAITLFVLFGLGWGLGLFLTQGIFAQKSVRDIFASLFVIVTTFQGLFIFIMHCLRSKDIRDTWKRAIFGAARIDFTNSSTFNRLHGKTFGGMSTAVRSKNLKVFSMKEKSFSTFSEKDGDSEIMQEYYDTKKGEAADEKEDIGGECLLDNYYNLQKFTSFTSDDAAASTKEVPVEIEPEGSKILPSLADEKIHFATEEEIEGSPIMETKVEEGLESLQCDTHGKIIIESDVKKDVAMPFPDDHD